MLGSLEMTWDSLSQLLFGTDLCFIIVYLTLSQCLLSCFCTTQINRALRPEACVF